MIKLSARVFLLVLTLALVPNCITPRGGKSNKQTTKVKKTKSKAGRKSKFAKKSKSKKTHTSRSKKRRPTVRELMAFINRHADSSIPLKINDKEFIDSIQKGPRSGSISEAALVVGLTKKVLFPTDLAVEDNFIESDIESADDAKGGMQPQETTNTASDEKPSMSTYCIEYNIDCPRAISQNPLLQTIGIAIQVIAALEVGQPDISFRNAIVQFYRAEAGKWSRILENTSPQELAATDTTAKTVPLPNAVVSTIDMAQADELLVEADEMADEGDIQGAINSVKQIPQNSPVFDQAQEKIQEYSNRAVQDLRRKAAQAFQSAVPVTDNKIRADYLRKAKGFLEQALNNYPDATQLPTVRDNLRVISRDLERIETEVEQG